MFFRIKNMTKITLRVNIENNFYLRKQNRGYPEFRRKAKEQMTECTTSHFTLTKYVTVENMASSPIQNIKCSPKSNLREGKILFPSQRIWTCCYWFYKKWKSPHMFVCFMEVTYHQLTAPNLYMIKKGWYYLFQLGRSSSNLLEVRISAHLASSI